jgi:hypothetical protein
MFKTQRAIRKHFETRHLDQSIESERIKFFNLENLEVLVPEIHLLNIGTEEYKNGYLVWLAGVAEQLNSSLHPNLPGKPEYWLRIPCDLALFSYQCSVLLSVRDLRCQ